MDWEKIKSIFIYLLIALNVGLVGANALFNETNRLTNAQEKAIYAVLEANGIGIYTDLIVKTPPMRTLVVTTSPLSAESFKDGFFEEGEEHTPSHVWHESVFATDAKSLSVSGNSFRYFNYDVNMPLISGFNQEKALTEANEFLAKVEGKRKGAVKLEKWEYDEEQDEYIFTYNELYKGYKLFNTQKTINVSNKGVIFAEAKYYAVEGFTGDSRNIISCDEALFTLISAVKTDEITGGIYVEAIDLGYIQNKDEIFDGNSIRLIPVYRIHISNGNDYTINAYTNELITEEQ